MKNQLNKLIQEYNSVLPLKDECKKELDRKFRLEFNFNSNHLEGNTLTYGETKLLLLFDQTKGSHEMREYEEMKAHDVALQVVQEEALNKEKPLTERFIKELNEIILVRPFWKDAETESGQSTRRMIKVGEYKEHPNHVRLANGEIFEYASPTDTPYMMAELVKWYNEEADRGEFSPIELASLLHYRYIRIHPFDDGNGRVARLLVNYVMFRNDLPPVVIKTETKKDYLRALQQADAGNLQAFVDYMMQQLAWSLDLTIRAAKGESTEEQNDWEKQLTLMKRGLGDKSDEVVKKSDQVVLDTFVNAILPFVAILDNKLSNFDSLFHKSRASVKIRNYSLEFENFHAGLENFILEMDKQKYNFTFNEINSFYFIYYFETLRNPYKKIKLSTSNITITFHENAYTVGWQDNIISKLYSDQLTEKEINSIISDIAKDLMTQIEKAIEEEN